MSENTINTAIEEESEVAFSEEETVEVTATQTEVDSAVSLAPTYESATARRKGFGNKVSAKEIVRFAKNNIFTSKVCTIILLCLGIAITTLCVYQIILWGISIKDSYSDYLAAIETLDFINIVVMAFILLFMIVLLVNIIKCIISLIKKGHEMRFEMVATIVSFYVFFKFVEEKLFVGMPLLISDFSFFPILKMLLILAGIYSVIRLFAKDFGSRIWSIIFSCVAIALAIVMFSVEVGNFATYTIDIPDGKPFSVQLSDLNIYNYIQSIIDAGSFDDGVTNQELWLLACSINFDEMAIFVVLLQFVPIMVANVLPYAAISLLAYLLYGLVGRNYTQYYNLQTCKKVSAVMLVVSIFSLAATIGLSVACLLTDTYLSIKIDYTNAIITLLLCIALIVITSLPWKIYKTTYRRRYAKYQKREGRD